MAAMSRVAMSGALYESMFVVESKATGEEILARSICTPGFFMLWERDGVESASGRSGRCFMRLVTARAIDMVIKSRTDFNYLE